MYYLPPGGPEHLHGGPPFYGPPGPPPPGVMLNGPDFASLRSMLAKQIEYYFRLNFILPLSSLYLSTFSPTSKVAKLFIIGLAV